MHVVLFKHAAVSEFNGEVERGLTADRWENGKARARRHLPLDADDLFKIFACERLDVSTSKPSDLSALQACVPE